MGVNKSGWLDLNGKGMRDITFNKVEIDELVTKDLVTGEYKPIGEGCIVLTGVDELDEKHKVTVHFDAKTGIYTVVDYNRG